MGVWPLARPGIGHVGADCVASLGSYAFGTSLAIVAFRETSDKSCFTEVRIVPSLVSGNTISIGGNRRVGAHTMAAAHSPERRCAMREQEWH